MTSKIIFLNIALILAEFLSASAQNNVPMPGQLNKPNARFEISKLPTIKKAKLDRDRWVPDTVCCFILTGDEGESGFVDRFIFKYNSYGLVEEDTHQYWDCVNDSWGRDEINTYTYTFDSNDNVLTKSIGNNSLFTYTYDSNNNRLTELRQSRVNDSWVNVALCTYTYDSNNNMLTELPQEWQNDSWVNSAFTYAYTYNSDHQMITKLDKLRGDSNFYLHTYTYDSSNNILNELIQGWSNNSWENGGLITYTYNYDNNRVTELRQRCLSAWENVDQYLRTYDENGNGTSVEYWRWSEKGWQPANNTMVGLKLYYNNMQSYFWGGYHKMAASYIKVSNLINGMEPIATQDLNAASIYPNPSNGALRIESGGLKIKNVELFDIHGLKILNSQFSTFNSFDISHLPTGMYFVKISTEKGIVTKKIVKK